MQNTLQDLEHLNVIRLTVFAMLISMMGFNFASGQTGRYPKAELVVQTGHTESVLSVALSPDGKVIASASADYTIKLWNVVSGQELKTLSGHKSSVRSVAFSANGQTLASVGSLDSIKLWDVVSGRELNTLAGYQNAANCVAYSPDGRVLAWGTLENTITLWDTQSAKEIATFSGHENVVSSIAFSPDGRTLASIGFFTVRLWDVASGVQNRVLRGHEGLVGGVVFSPDGKTLATGGSDSVKLWHVATGQLTGNLVGHTGNVSSIAFSSDGRFLASAGKSTIRIWDAATGREQGILSGHDDLVNSVVFLPDNRSVLSAGNDKTIRLWDIDKGQDITKFGGSAERFTASEFSSDGRLLALGAEKQVKIWDIESNKHPVILTGHTDLVTAITFSPNGKLLASGGAAPWDRTVRIWDVSTGKTLSTLVGHRGTIYTVSFSPDGKSIASGSRDGIVKIWNVPSGIEIRSYPRKSNGVTTLSFSPNGELLAIGEWDFSITLRKVDSGEEIRVLRGHQSQVTAVAFSPDGSSLASESYEDRTVRLWKTESGEEYESFAWTDKETIGKVTEIVPSFFRLTKSFLIAPNGKLRVSMGSNRRLDLYDNNAEELSASIVTFKENDWAVVTPDGLFDASPGARKLMHYVLGLEPITLEQMKDMYYVPGLLQKIFKGEPLPKVELFSRKDLFPEAVFSPPRPGEDSFDIKLTNRGGGIGRVQVLINGKEFIADARPAGFDPDTKEASLTVSLAGAPFVGTEENRIEVIARNTEGSLTNRGTPKGSVKVRTAGDKRNQEPPEIYAIVGGVSDYTGDGLDLTFAAKDAEDFAKAIELGAVKLIGDKSKVHIRLLTSSGEASGVKFDVPDTNISTATKEDFNKAFSDFSGATSNDIFIVYLSGHGTSLNLNPNPQQAGGDTYLYLTQEATSSSREVLISENARKAMALSSDEIKDLMKQNKALKQILILDTCAAGAAVPSLVGKRNMPSDQIKALERLKDNTGFYVLMGSAADKVSYEASKYGQGLLTYSLLQGMRGARLRDGGYAYVSELFGYAQDTVPQLAVNIGGIQRPLIIAPDASGNFPFGRFTETEWKGIRLSSPKPQILRPRLINQEMFRDDLKLQPLLKEALRNISFVSARGSNETPLVFIDAEEMQDAIAPSGSYVVEDEEITVTIVLEKNNEQLGEKIVVKGSAGNKKELIDRLVAAISEASVSELGGQ